MATEISRKNETGMQEKLDLAKAKAADTLGKDRSKYVSDTSSVGPDFSVAHRASRTDNSDGSKIGPNMGSTNKMAKHSSHHSPVKPLKDTSGNYWSASGLSGEHGSASGEAGADMMHSEAVGGYDPIKGKEVKWSDSY